MKNVRCLLKLGGVIILAASLQSCIVADVDRRGGGGGDVRFVACGGEHRLRVMDLDISPDPIADGQAIRTLRVRVRADGTGECQTTFQVRERDGDLVARDRVYRLRPGINEVVFEPLERYRFDRSEHCFEVSANIAGNYRRIDAERTFCARRIDGRRWTLRG
jgi:hypothetical protein